MALNSLLCADVPLSNYSLTLKKIGWRRGSMVSTSVFGWWTFPDLCLIYGWLVTTLWVVKCLLCRVTTGPPGKSWKIKAMSCIFFKLWNVKTARKNNII